MPREGRPYPEPLLTPEEVAVWLRVSTKTLANRRWSGDSPDFVKLGKGPKAPVRYRPSAVEEWFAENDSELSNRWLGPLRDGTPG